MRLILMPPDSRGLDDAFGIAHLLVDAGVTPRTAKSVIEELATGRTAYVEAPEVRDYGKLQREMARFRIVPHQVKLRVVDVKILRARLGISQEAFAGRYCLDVATVRNWEQGRTKPEGPAAALLQLIDRDPDKITELLAS
jgi:DNA-binding transcriptional regulator YiaG